MQREMMKLLAIEWLKGLLIQVAVVAGLVFMAFYFTGCASPDAHSVRYEIAEKVAAPILDTTYNVKYFYSSIFKTQNGFELFYERGQNLTRIESTDGLTWSLPQTVKAFSKPTIGTSVVKDQQGTYQFIGNSFTLSLFQTPQTDFGMVSSQSTDGFNWSEPSEPLLKGDRGLATDVQDIYDLFFDPIHNRYGAAIKSCAVAADGYTPGPRSDTCIRRLVSIIWTTDFVNWTTPERIIVPDSKDEGLTEFYGMHVRYINGQFTGFLRVLRDDVNQGIGWTEVVTSKDGVTWTRTHQTIIPRGATGSFDAAMAWISSCIENEQTLWCYYGGYDQGHKVGNRQMGLIKLNEIIK